MWPSDRAIGSPREASGRGVDPKDDHVMVTLDVRLLVDGQPTAWRRTVDYRVADGLIAEATVVESDQALADRLFA